MNRAGNPWPCATSAVISMANLTTFGMGEVVTAGNIPLKQTLAKGQTIGYNSTSRGAQD